MASKNHGNGAPNPNAHFGKETSVEEVLDGPIVADPFRLMDCYSFSDGASAAVDVSEELADSFEKPVDVMEVGHATDVVLIGDKVDPHATEAARDAAAAAYEQAGTTAEDVDFAEVHDCFTRAEILASEALDLIEDGKGDVAAEEG